MGNNSLYYVKQGLPRSAYCGFNLGKQNSRAMCVSRLYRTNTFARVLRSQGIQFEFFNLNIITFCTRESSPLSRVVYFILADRDGYRVRVDFWQYGYIVKTLNLSFDCLTGSDLWNELNQSTICNNL